MAAQQKSIFAIALKCPIRRWHDDKYFDDPGILISPGDNLNDKKRPLGAAGKILETVAQKKCLLSIDSVAAI